MDDDAFALAGYRVLRLGESDLTALDRFHIRCTDFERRGQAWSRQEFQITRSLEQQTGKRTHIVDELEQVPTRPWGIELVFART